MIRYFLPAFAVSMAFAAGSTYEVTGRILPKMRAAVSLYGATSPFAESAFVLPGYSFHFKNLKPGAYTLAIFSRRRGEFRRTIEVGPGTADRHGRVLLKLNLQDSDFVLAPALNRNTVSTKQLSVPDAAWRDYFAAQKELKKRNVAAAEKRLEDAVERAPQFSVAWNNLGTIAYQQSHYDRAEECFREALGQDPQSYEALVNLGGVLVTEHKLDEALTRNSVAVQTRPSDALAQSQLGMTYYLLGQFELAKKRLEEARRLDPAHFSYPQLLLADIDVREGDRHAAADALEDFLAHHPDWPQAAGVRQKIAEFRSQ